MKYKCTSCGYEDNESMFLSGICPACCINIETGEPVKDAIPTVFHMPEQTAPDADRSIRQRLADHNKVLNRTRDPRAAIRAYCSGNRWLTENAKAVGNW